jgi:hypothetical protein
VIFKSNDFGRIQRSINKKLKGVGMNKLIKYNTIFKYLVFLYLIMIFPVSQILPAWISWENNILENLQVIVLSIGCITGIFFYRQSKNIHCKMWLVGSGVFLLLIGRELSWGRVFFQTAMTENGPEFISMRQVPYHNVLYFIIGIYMVILAIGLITMIPWKNIFKSVQFPTAFFGMLCITVILSTWGDHGWTFHDFRDETIEELAELLMYALLNYIMVYYHAWLKNNKSMTLNIRFSP